MAEEITRKVLYCQVFDLYATSVDYNPHSEVRQFGAKYITGGNPVW